MSQNQRQQQGSSQCLITEVSLVLKLIIQCRSYMRRSKRSSSQRKSIQAKLLKSNVFGIRFLAQRLKREIFSIRTSEYVIFVHGMVQRIMLPIISRIKLKLSQQEILQQIIFSNRPIVI